MTSVGRSRNAVTATGTARLRHQQRMLGLIFGHPERSFYISEIIRTVRSGTGAAERELSRLRRSGHVSAEQIGNQMHYRTNAGSPVLEELRGLVRKAVGFADPVRMALEPFAARIGAAHRLALAALRLQGYQSTAMVASRAGS